MRKNGGKIIQIKLKNGGYKVLAQWALRLFLLIVLAVMVFPLFMLTANSLMGRQKLLETCGAVLADYGESAKLRVLERI